MEEKVQTSLWLRRDVKRLVEDNNVNLTQLVNDLLEKYFSVSNREDIVKKLEATKGLVTALESRLASFDASHEAVDTLEQSSGLILEEIQNLYVAHRIQDPDDEKGVLWISSPKNLRRCSMLDKKPAEILAELRSWYDVRGK